MIRYILKQNQNNTSSAYQKYYAYPVVEQTMNLNDLARHMSEHDSGFSEAMIVGVLKAMVRCIKEMILEGKNVKIDDLAIFSCGIKNTPGGAESEDDFTVSKNIRGVKLRVRATGELTASSLNLEAQLKKATAVVGTKTTTSTTPSE